MVGVDLAVGLAFVASLCFGLQAHAVEFGMTRSRRAIQRAPALSAALISIVVSAGLFWGYGLLRGLPAITVTGLLPFAIAGLAYPGAFRLLYFRGIDSVGPSVAGAIVAGNPALAAVFAILLLGENATLAAGAGVVLIAVGGGLIQLTYNAAQESDADATDVVVRKLVDAELADLLAPVGALVMIASGYTLFKFGLDRFPHPVTATATAQTAALVVFVAVVLLSRDTRSEVRETVGARGPLAAFVVAGLLVAMAWITQFVALNLGTVVTIVPLINTFPLVIVAVAYTVERQLPRSPYLIAGVLAIVLGASLIQVF